MTLFGTFWGKTPFEQTRYETWMKITELRRQWLTLFKNDKGHTLRLYNELLILLNPRAEDEVACIIEELRPILNGFWEWVFTNLSHDEWIHSETVKPWIEFQDVLVKENLLKTNYHYPILYQVLADEYHFAQTELTIPLLLSLLKDFVTHLGYIEPEQIAKYYPLHNLEKTKDESKHTNITLLTTLFWLIHSLLTEEQKKLIPFLIYFCTTTTTSINKAPPANKPYFTDEERDAAIAIYRFLLNKGTMSELFFEDPAILACLKQSESTTSYDSLNEGLKLLGRTHIHQVFELIKLFINPQPNDVEKLANRLIEFWGPRFISPNELLAFTKKLKHFFTTLNITKSKEQEILFNNALTFLRVQAYIANRQIDKRVKFSSYAPFNKGLKIDTAKEYLEQLKEGKALSYIAQLALDQGDLKSIIEDSIEEFEDLSSEEVEEIPEEKLPQLAAILANPDTNDVEHYANKLIQIFHSEFPKPNQILVFTKWLKLRVAENMEVKKQDLFENTLIFLRLTAYITHRESDDRPGYSALCVFDKKTKLDAAKEIREKLKQPKSTPGFFSGWLSSWLPNISWWKAFAAKQGELREVIDGSLERFEDLDSKPIKLVKKADIFPFIEDVITLSNISSMSLN